MAGVRMVNLLVFSLLIFIPIITAAIYLFFLIVKALKKYINSNEVRTEKTQIKKSLGQTLKEHRNNCKMTQEFVAESLGVSRQAVSKWESGVSDPSTSNLLALCKLYGISPEELLKNISSQ
ncbi:MAG: helix-turn-helix transcriptional regulator [Ruminococcaceae bacterium]|nr:helix-turn-helix transcriptional regulator [Oscillospiraceae bacterium]